MSRSEGQRCLGDCSPRLIPTLLRLGSERRRRPPVKVPMNAHRSNTNPRLAAPS